MPTKAKDIVVFDPPYIHNPGQHITDHRYRNAATTKGLYHSDIIDLYRAGMTEAKRVLKPEGGQLWVKCKNEIESGIQRWSIIEIYNIAIALGMFGRDLFTLVPDARTSSNRWKRQLHARKVHSYMWVFERPKRSDQAGLRRAGVIPPLLGPLPLP
jgi:Methylase of polypeptide chain release factors